MKEFSVLGMGRNGSSPALIHLGGGGVVLGVGNRENSTGKTRKIKIIKHLEIVGISPIIPPSLHGLSGFSCFVRVSFRCGIKYPLALNLDRQSKIQNSLN